MLMAGGWVAGGWVGGRGKLKICWKIRWKYAAGGKFNVGNLKIQRGKLKIRWKYADGWVGGGWLELARSSKCLGTSSGARPQARAGILSPCCLHRSIVEVKVRTLGLKL